MAVVTKGTILVTGANGGLGSALAHHVATSAELSSYHGFYTVRDTTKASVLNSPLESGPTHGHDIVSLDLTSLNAVRRVAEHINVSSQTKQAPVLRGQFTRPLGVLDADIMRQERVATGEIPPIRALILNAGYQDFGKQTSTADGLDTVFAANFLGHWLLTLLLLQSVDKQVGRIVVIGSQSHDPTDPRNTATGAFIDPRYKNFVSDTASFESIAKGEWSRSAERAGSMDGFKTGFRRYGTSKLFLIMMQHELQARLNRDPILSDICVLGVDPGTMPSGLRLGSYVCSCSR